MSQRLEVLQFATDDVVATPFHSVEGQHLGLARIGVSGTESSRLAGFLRRADSVSVPDRYVIRLGLARREEHLQELRERMMRRPDVDRCLVVTSFHPCEATIDDLLLVTRSQRMLIDEDMRGSLSSVVMSP